MVEFSPADGAAFKVLLTVIPGRAGATPPSREAVAAGTARAAAKAAERSIEPAPLAVRTLVGASMFGNYFEATDRQPEPTGFKHLTQGTAVIDTTSVAFTVLANDVAASRAADIERAALQMLSSARRLAGRTGESK